MNRGLTLAKLMQAAAILNKAPVPMDGRIIYTTTRQMRNQGFTPLQIQNAIRSGRLVKAGRIT